MFIEHEELGGRRLFYILGQITQGVPHIFGVLMSAGYDNDPGCRALFWFSYLRIKALLSFRDIVFYFNGQSPVGLPLDCQPLTLCVNDSSFSVFIFFPIPFPYFFNYQYEFGIISSIIVPFRF